MSDVYARYAEALRMGHQQAAEGRFKDALHHYRAAAELAGERALPHVALGGMYLRLGHAREALAAYERALGCAPDDLDALSGRAAALLAAGRRAEAAAAQARIDERARGLANGSAPAGPQTPMSRADTLMIAGDQARAAGDHAAAVEAWLAESTEHAAAERYDAALDACLRALALDSSAVAVHVALARIYARRGWLDEARQRAQLLRRLLDLRPEPAIQEQLDQVVERVAWGAPAAA
jgi:tetratricopeptide (TPR) repeat protein